MLVATLFSIFLNFYKYSYYERKLYIIKKKFKKKFKSRKFIEILDWN